MVESQRIHVVGVATVFAWEVVETCRRLGLTPVCVDNYGGAHDRLLDELRDAYTQLGQAHQDAAALQMDVAELCSSKRRLRQDNARLTRKAAKAQDRLAQIESSHSWRLTAPLRRLRSGR
ncbi:MAG: hypothetical protein KDB38_10295 [Nocardioidaceae bacterium]|nr:hypothetical protein [Nocardioidaceae bacterium]MCB8993122.1 hypothetical protein [Nocardioidaceae bacterium]MCO5323069.1 hypothetical protein [Nocardioidaceae bacterium]